MNFSSWTSPTVIVALMALLGQTLAVLTGSFLSQRWARRAQASAAEAQLAVERAKADAADATTKAMGAARVLVEASKASDRKLDSIKNITSDTNRAIKEVKETTDVIHDQGNSSRSELLNLVADLSQRISELDPDNQFARSAMARTRRDADR